MPHDFSGDLGPCDQRLSHDKAGIAMNKPDLIQFDQGTDVSGQALNLNG